MQHAARRPVRHTPVARGGRPCCSCSPSSSRQSIQTSRRQHEEQAVVETYSVARVLESDLANLVDKVRLALHTVAIERERRLAGGARTTTRPRAPTSPTSTSNLRDVLGIRVADEAGRLVYQTEFATAPAEDLGGQP